MSEELGIVPFSFCLSPSGVAFSFAESDYDMITIRAASVTAIPALSEVEILRVIHQAFDRAVGTPVDLTMPQGRQNRQRSQTWVSCLRSQSAAAYRRAGYEDVRALCGSCADNEREFGLKELLHDVCVCRVATVASQTHKIPLTYVREVLWQVESELKNDGTEAIRDFNKLILGSAQQKLFVGPISDHMDADLNVLLMPATCCAGEVYAAFIEHPDRWASSPRTPCLYRFIAQGPEWQATGKLSPA